MRPTLLSTFWTLSHTLNAPLRYTAKRLKHTTSPPFRLTDPPNPRWNLGDRPTTHDTNVKRRTWDLRSGTQSTTDVYRLLTSAIIPRPVAFISTVSETGQHNLAPFSYFSMVSHNPPMISVSFSLSKRRPKDTRENILQSKKFTVNMISESFAEAANSTSVKSPADVNEWIISGLTMEQGSDGWPPVVGESAVSMECELYSFQNIASSSGEITTTVVLGTITKVIARESVLDKDGLMINPAELRPISRLGGTSYGRLTEGFDLPRLSWKDIRDRYDELAKGREC